MIVTISQPINVWYMWFGAIGFVISGIFWITFSQLTMRRIEKDIEKNMIDKGFVWDGLGSRIFPYAFAIVFPEKIALRFNRLIDVSLVRSYAVKGDWWRALFFLSSTYLWIAISLIGLALGFAGSQELG